jgi:uncharacterized membrane protein YkoI
MTPEPVLFPALSPEEVPAPVETPEPEVLKMRETESFMSAEEPVKYIGVDAALEAALNHAEIKKQDAEIIGVVRTKDEDGKAVYQVGFQAGELAYDYTLDAVSGEIDSYTVSGLHVSDNATFAASFTGDALTEAEAVKDTIGEEEAKELAYKHASVKPAEVVRVTVELTDDPEISETSFYHLEFKTATKSFRYDVDAGSGEILGFEKK